MTPIDLLVQQVPAWLALTLFLAGVVASRFLDHILQRRRSLQQSSLELLQTRHQQKLDALDQINGALREFDHAVDHLCRGDDYLTRLEDYCQKARDLARKHELLLGREFHDAVIRCTDLGKAVIEAGFILSEDTLERLRRDEPTDPLRIALDGFPERRIPIASCSSLLRGLAKETARRIHNEILPECAISPEFDAMGYMEVNSALQKMTSYLVRTLVPQPGRRADITSR